MLLLEVMPPPPLPRPPPPLPPFPPAALAAERAAALTTSTSPPPSKSSDLGSGGASASPPPKAAPPRRPFFADVSPRGSSLRAPGTSGTPCSTATSGLGLSPGMPTGPPKKWRRVAPDEGFLLLLLLPPPTPKNDSAPPILLPASSSSSSSRSPRGLDKITPRVPLRPLLPPCSVTSTTARAKTPPARSRSGDAASRDPGPSPGTGLPCLMNERERRPVASGWKERLWMDG